jgi:hypothetical protein
MASGAARLGAAMLAGNVPGPCREDELPLVTERADNEVRGRGTKHAAGDWRGRGKTGTLSFLTLMSWWRACPSGVVPRTSDEFERGATLLIAVPTKQAPAGRSWSPGLTDLLERASYPP